MDTTADDLVNLREQILEQTVPLLESESIPINERFQLILQLARTKGTIDLYRRAFEIAQGMEANNKFDAYYDLLGAVDTAIGGKADFSTEDEATDNSENFDNQNSENHGEGQ